MTNQSEFKANLQQQMLSVVDGCVAPGDFGPHFVPHWFWKIGQPYCFVFKKNLHVTNIQIAELFSLLRSHVSSSDAESELRLSSIPAFEKQLSRFMETFSEDLQDIRESLSRATQKIVELYLDYFAHLCLIDPHFGSCLISISPLYSIDLESVCFLSGYIHSSGPCIYARDIYHSRYPRFFKHIISYLDSLKRHKDSKPILFRPYSHEDFTKHDRDQEEDLTSGLDELKLRSTKQYAGDLVLATMIENLRQEKTLEGRLTIAKPGHSGLDIYLVDKVDPSRTFWLIMDSPVSPANYRHSASFAEARLKSNRHTLICYDQQILNDNPFHIFDENKPGWYDHTTIPHTLMGAMINITRPYWPRRIPVNICDPFSGGGTAWLESCKFHDVCFTGFDLEPVSQIVSIDNLDFFSMPTADLDAIYTSIGKTFDNYMTPPQQLDEIAAWDNSKEKSSPIGQEIYWPVC